MLSFHQRGAVRWEAYSGAREPSWLGALLTPSPTVLRRLTVLSHPRLAGDIMDGNGWQLSEEPLSLLGRDNKGRLEGEQGRIHGLQFLLLEHWCFRGVYGLHFFGRLDIWIFTSHTMMRAIIWVVKTENRRTHIRNTLRLFLEKRNIHILFSNFQLRCHYTTAG